MTLTWTIAAIWFAIQLPLGILVGRSIKLGMEEPVGATGVGARHGSARRRSRRRGLRWSRSAARPSMTKKIIGAGVREM
jgi:hypothetical protein